MLEGDRLCAALPHSGAMCLLDELVEWDGDSAVCTAVSHLDPRNPLARDGGLATVHAVEYASQAAAAHGALSAPRRAPGHAVLAAVKEVELGQIPLHRLPGPLRIAVRRELGAGLGAIYSFLVECGGDMVARGRLVVAESPEGSPSGPSTDPNRATTR